MTKIDAINETVLTGRGRWYQYADWSVVQTSYCRSCDMHDPIAQARIRARSFWYRDGLTEIWLGIFFLIEAGSIPFQGSWFAVLIYLVVLAGFVRIMRMVRERITYRRSGYMEPGESVRKYRIWFVAVTIPAIIALALAFRYRDVIGWDPNRWEKSLPVVVGLLTFAISVYANVRYRLPRYLLVGLFSLVLGVAVGIKCSPTLAIEIWLAGVGCAWLCAGGFTLRKYLRNTPPVAYRT
jgi:hypothetical protein